MTFLHRIIRSRGIALFCFTFTVFSSIKTYASIQTLFEQSDVVLTGKIKFISGPMNGDLGTDHYYVTLDVDSIYKRRFVSPTQPIQLHWIVSNLRCSEIPMSNCITKHEGEQKIFFLKKAHFFEGAEIPDSLILTLNELNRQTIHQLSNDDLIWIEPFKSEKTCSHDCGFCHSIEEEDWEKVEKHIAKNANNERRLDWMRHRAIKWVMPDRFMLSSLPSYQSVRYLFITNKREVEAMGYFQIGYYKTFATWIPHVLYKLFRAQAYRHFSRENYDTMMLMSFEVDKVTSPQYLSFDRSQYERQIHDSTWTTTYGESIHLDSNLVLLASVYEGPTALYEDYKTMPNYEQNAFNYIDTLLKHQKVYSLCVMSNHAIPAVAAYSVRALGSLKDRKAIPFLIQLANHEVEGPFTPAHFDDRNELRKAIIETLDILTGTTTTSRT